MKNTDVLKNLERILDSETKNYLEGSERLILMNIFEKLNVETNQLTENEYNLVNKIIQKYKKFLD